MIGIIFCASLFAVDEDTVKWNGQAASLPGRAYTRPTLQEEALP